MELLFECLPVGDGMVGRVNERYGISQDVHVDQLMMGWSLIRMQFKGCCMEVKAGDIRHEKVMV